MKFSFFLILCTWASQTCGQAVHNILYDEQVSKATQLFTGLEGVKNYFRNNTTPLAQSILSTFENECIYMDEPVLPEGKDRKPFIVIEGNHKNSREVVGVKLAAMMDGRYLVHPASCLIKYADVIPRGTLIRRAFYALSLYATSFNVKVHLSLGRAVVLNGYWLDQMSFALVQSFPHKALPPPTSTVYNGPAELLRPDLIFYLNLPDDLFYPQATTRRPSNWKSRALTLYKELARVGYPIVVQNLKGVFRMTTGAVYRQMYDQLTDKRDVARLPDKTN